jgi:hypothetical protein
MPNLCYWYNGKQYFVGNDGAGIMTIDYPNHTLTIPSGATLDVSAGTAVPAITQVFMSSTIPYFTTTATILTSATSYTISAAQLLSGFISDTTATGPIAATLPLVTDVVALLPAAAQGAKTSFFFAYRNIGNQTVTMTTNTGWGTLSAGGTMTILSGSVREFQIILTNATTAVLYSMGTAVI